jgi:cytochrome b561
MTDTTAAQIRAVPAYTAIARAAHWFTALVVIAMIPLGIVIANELGGPLQDALYDLHRSVGAILLSLIVLRLLHRWRYPPVPLSNEISTIQRHAAQLVHGSMYALLILQPLVGWIATSAYGASIGVFGWFELPALWPQDRTWSEQLFFVHGLLGLALAFLVAAHVGAALYHHVVRKDGVLMRMITG